MNPTREEARDLSGGKAHLNDHLRNTLTTEGLAADKLLALQTGQRVEDSSDGEHNGGGDQTRGTGDETSPLDTTHDGIHSGAHPVGCEAADEGIELGGCRANAKQEGYLNEEDDE
jgi:hypothetical protein